VRGTSAAWTHLSLDGMPYKRIIILFNIRYRYKYRDRDIKMKVKIYIEMIIQREIGLGSEGVYMSWIIFYPIVFYWSKNSKPIYTPPS
jgi:hypothetical protein